MLSEKIRYRGEENDRKVFESSSPAKYKSKCTQNTTHIIRRILDMYLQRRCRHKHKQDALLHNYKQVEKISFYNMRRCSIK